MRYSNPFHRIINASRYSLNGLYYALKNEQAFQYEAVVLIVLCIILFIISLPLMYKLYLVFIWLIVMALELVNSSVEKAFDLIDEHYRPEIKAGKDMLSSAVFIMICFNIFSWTAVIFEVLIH